MADLNHLLAPYALRVEMEMRALVPPMDQLRSFYGQLYYHLGWADGDYEPAEAPGGKRVRAALCLMVCEAFTGGIELALPAAAAVEFLHEFSLVHDDIEDGDRSRHHRPTLWSVVGQPQAINAGDGLFALAQMALLSSTNRGVPNETVLAAQQRFNETALNLCLGQHLDMAFEEQDIVSPEAYLEMVRGKTAALLAFAGEVGAMMAGADDETVNTIRLMGEALGLAYQMRDDLLGLWGDSARTGKPVGADIRAKKKSLPIAYALSQPDNDELRALYRNPLETDEQVNQAQRLIEATGAREYVITLAEEQENCVLQMLDRIAVPAGTLTSLRRLSELLGQRQH